MRVFSRMVESAARAPRGVLEHVYLDQLRREVRSRPVPRHIAVIMDGNRRFARRKGLEAADGHLFGSETLEQLLDWCREADVRALTVYALSTENLGRSPEELAALMSLFERKLDEIGRDPRVHRHGIRVRVVGRPDLLPEPVVAAARRAEEATESYDRFDFRICLAYGGRQEIVDAVRELAVEVAAGRLAPEQIDERSLAVRLAAGADEPDLVIRTGGEVRLSNFLLFQSAYSELFFTDVHFPAFREIDFLRIVRTYQQRTRRFGK